MSEILDDIERWESARHRTESAVKGADPMGSPSYLVQPISTAGRGTRRAIPKAGLSSVAGALQWNARFLGVTVAFLLAACDASDERDRSADATVSSAPVPAPAAAPVALPDSAALLAWADSIDALADGSDAAERVYATRGDSLVAVTDSAAPIEGGESEIRVLLGEDGTPLRHLEAPSSESGDWGLTLTHYFDPSGRTRVFASIGRFAGNPDCGGGVMRDIRYTMYRPDGSIVHQSRAILDEADRPVDVSACGHLYDFFAGNPRPSYETLVEEGRAPSL